jgi:tetratricopeptide (TPR) repeat protein
MLHLCRFRPPVWLAVAGLLVAVPVPCSAEESAEPAERPAAEAQPARTDSVADALLEAGDVPGAVARYEHDLMTSRASLPPEHPDLAVYHDRLGTLSWMLGDDERARTELEAALLIYERAHGANYGPMAEVLARLGAIALELGDAPAAVKAHKRGLAIAENEDPTGAATADALDRLGTALGSAGELKEAAEAHLRALQLYEGMEGDSSRRVPCLQHLAEDARRLGDRDRARAYLLRSRSILIAIDGGQEHPRMAGSIGGLAALAAAEGDQDRARAYAARPRPSCAGRSGPSILSLPRRSRRTPDR